MLRQTAGAYDKATFQVAPGNQFLDEQARHNGFAGPRIISQEKTQRLARQHGLIDCGNLVRQRVHNGGMHRQQRVEQVRKTDALSFGDQAKHGPVPIEAPGTASFNDLQPVFVVAVQYLVCDLSRSCLVGQFKRLGTEPADVDYGDGLVGNDAFDRAVGLKVFEFHVVFTVAIITVTGAF